MSKDGYLPDNVSESDFDRAFPPDCPDSCASNMTADVYSECGGIGKCQCFPNTLRGRLNLWWQGPCEVSGPPECDCPTRSEILAERAEARYEAGRKE